jgi:hypothetical protein
MLPEEGSMQFHFSVTPLCFILSVVNLGPTLPPQIEKIKCSLKSKNYLYVYSEWYAKIISQEMRKGISHEMFFNDIALK